MTTDELKMIFKTLYNFCYFSITYKLDEKWTDEDWNMMAQKSIETGKENRSNLFQNKCLNNWMDFLLGEIKDRDRRREEQDLQ